MALTTQETKIRQKMYKNKCFIGVPSTASRIFKNQSRGLFYPHHLRSNEQQTTALKSERGTIKMAADKRNWVPRPFEWDGFDVIERTVISASLWPDLAAN